MCDEYDDERMRVFWRQLAMREELVRLDPQPDPDDKLVVKPFGEVVEAKRAKPRVLTR